ncbi:oligosaccharide flippase family protein [Lelliottia sp. V89_10]|uniref:lipopolysaccharide biosynthesis protein n=1 Tax=Lelliottia wanjuensis TaxID=3050585 RepID=UPI00249DBB22|nr:MULTISPECIES: oligosaccharide flippase family protein [unclassified Lelliottia]MDI3361449.1 oligosaccharide flippase family protein [Lelliottia sp. V89_13]MDK9549350.1 oligosaccharide flippase family protein [Lelliottia sp. V89_5]MDK9596051.1 oligosaccharide flippase family protein [Lelliottia sp. V89_10]
MKKNIIDLGMLYFGKVGALVVGFFLMPVYSLILGPTQFSSVAFILSLVNAAVTLDFGMSTIIGRDSSDHSIHKDKNYNQYIASLMLVTSFYSLIFLITLLYNDLFSNQINIRIQFFSLVLILSSLIQNISISYLNGIKEFRVSGGMLFLSVIARGMISYLVIKYYNDSVIAFMFTQAVISFFFAIIFIALPSLLFKRNYIDNEGYTCSLRTASSALLVLPLARKGLPLLFMGVSATLVMQLDKIVLAHFAPAATLSAYYLAFTFSTIPILAVAGPIKQYFQPYIVSHLSQGNEKFRDYSLKLFWCLIIFVAVPSAIGYPFLKTIISIWLGNNILIDDVVSFSLILLPAFALGAISYFPSVLLIVAEDYKFQSVFAIITSILFAVILYLLAMSGVVTKIPWLFFIYFFSVIIFCSLRCIYLRKVKVCVNDVLKHCPFALLGTAVAYVIGHYASILVG